MFSDLTDTSIFNGTFGPLFECIKEVVTKLVLQLLRSRAGKSFRPRDRQMDCQADSYVPLQHYYFFFFRGGGCVCVLRYGRPLLQAWLLPNLNIIPNNCVGENFL